MRVIGAMLLVAVGCIAAWIAWGPLQNLFGYRDGTIATYLLYGLPWLAVAVAAFASARRLLKR